MYYSSRVCNFLGAQYRRAFAFVQFYRGRLCLKKYILIQSSDIDLLAVKLGLLQQIAVLSSASSCQSSEHDVFVQ